MCLAVSPHSAVIVTVTTLTGSSYAPTGKGASVRTNKTSVGWAKKAAGAREEAQSPKVCTHTNLITIRITNQS